MTEFSIKIYNGFRSLAGKLGGPILCYADR